MKSVGSSQNGSGYSVGHSWARPRRGDEFVVSSEYGCGCSLGHSWAPHGTLGTNAGYSKLISEARRTKGTGDKFVEI